MIGDITQLRGGERPGREGTPEGSYGALSFGVGLKPAHRPVRRCFRGTNQILLTIDTQLSIEYHHPEIA
jgi:hypothetical protein